MDAQHVSDELLEQLFSRLGVEDAIAMLASYLKEYIPFERMIWYVSDLLKHVRIPLVVVEHSEVRIGDRAHRFPNPSSAWSDKHYVDADRIFILDNELHPLEDGSLTDMFDDRQSLVSMVLIRTATFHVTMTLTSSRTGQFHMDHLEILRILRAPLASLARKFFRSAGETPLMLASEDAPPLSSLEMLRTCHGLRGVVDVLEGIAPTDITVLLQGETGVGKELCADALHSLSERRQAPFVRVNCAAMTETLLDDAFFGHEQGAFTGASKTYMGFFEQANTGTLFLDEVGELSPAAQARLLRVLETQDLQRVGGRRRILVDVRIVAATHRDLAAMVEQGTFREDLWYRLSVFPLRIPPLRERKEDVMTLARLFYQKGARQLRGKTPPALTKGYLASLVELPWKGNVRELRNRVEQDMVMASLRRLEALVPHSSAADSPNVAQAAGVPARHPSAEVSLLSRLDELTARHITDALGQCRWRVNGPFGAAAMLGVNPSTLRGRMKKLGIVKPGTEEGRGGRKDAGEGGNF